MTYVNSFFRQETALASLRLLFGSGKHADAAAEGSTGVRTLRSFSVLPPGRSASERISELLMGARIIGSPFAVVVPGDARMIEGSEGNDVVTVAGATGEAELNYVFMGRGNDVLNLAAAGDATSDYWQGELGGAIVEGPYASIIVHGQQINGGAGDDTLNISAGRDVTTVIGGEGNDRLNVAAGREAVGIIGESGNDSLNVSARVLVDNVSGGEGSDMVNVAAGLQARSIIGGRGDDILNVAAGHSVWEVRGGSGNDVVNVASGEHAGLITGDDGNDVVNVTATAVVSVDGGTGDDVIAITALSAERIAGGRGNDVISFGGTENAALFFQRGDGRDLVSIAGETTISFAGLSLEDVTITHGEESITVAFADSGDSVTIDYSKATLKGAQPALDLERTDCSATRRTAPAHAHYYDHADGFTLTIS